LRTGLRSGWWRTGLRGGRGRIGASATGVADRLRRAAAAAPALDGDDLEVERSQGQAERFPRVKVVLHRDGSAASAALAD